MKTFREYIAEEISDKFSHFTSLNGLYDMLKHGSIKGRKYFGNKDQLQLINKYNKAVENDSKHSSDFPKEFCLIRKSNKGKISSISCSNPEVEIIFDLDNIANLRGVGKPYPVSEFSIRDMKAILAKLKYAETQNILTPQETEKIYSLYLQGNKKGFNDFIKNIKSFQWLLQKIKFTNVDKLDDVFNQISNYLTSVQPDYEKKNKLEEWARLCDINTTIKIIKHNIFKKEGFNLFAREGEERLDLSKSEIPISSKYMKIILPKTFDGYESLKKVIEGYTKKDPNLFEYKDRKWLPSENI